MPDPTSLHVAVLIVCHNGRRHLEDCLSSVLASEDGPGIERRVVVVDNGSSDDSAAYVTSHFPQVELVRSLGNLGFAGGNNLGWRHIRATRPGTDYLVLLNQDTIVTSGWLRPLVEHLERHPHVAAAQAKLRLHPQTDRINSAGNRCHFLGFGFTTGGGEIDAGQYDRPEMIDFPSGAAAIVRASLLPPDGIFDPVLFHYLDDMELGWRMRLMGHDIAYLPASVVYHKYRFSKNLDFYYFLERNRWWLILCYYKLATLLLIAPALAAMEAGQWWFAFRNGRLRDKLRSYAFFLGHRNRSMLTKRRRQIQRQRGISDRQFLRGFRGRIDFPDLDSPLLRHVANPLLDLYWRIARRLIFW